MDVRKNRRPICVRSVYGRTKRYTHVSDEAEESEEKMTDARLWVDGDELHIRIDDPYRHVWGNWTVEASEMQGPRHVLYGPWPGTLTVGMGHADLLYQTFDDHGATPDIAYAARSMPHMLPRRTLHPYV